MQMKMWELGALYAIVDVHQTILANHFFGRHAIAFIQYTCYKSHTASLTHYHSLCTKYMGTSGSKETKGSLTQAKITSVCKRAFFQCKWRCRE